LIAIIDYGMGNLRSVQKALEHLGAPCKITSNLAGAEKAILPGVGAFPAAMDRLDPLRAEIDDFVSAGRPLLGICLGQQLLFEESDEFGLRKGLGYIPGRVEYLLRRPGLKLPHMGWAPLFHVNHSHALLRNIPETAQVFFVHSLVTRAGSADVDVLATCRYGDDEFPAAVAYKNVMATQFHPEKSGSTGLRMLRNFVEC
jgi:glutamine amidotransferase